MITLLLSVQTALAAIGAYTVIRRITAEIIRHQVRGSRTTPHRLTD